MGNHRKKNQTSEGAAPSRNIIGLAVGGGLVLAALSMQNKKPQPGLGPPPKEQPFSPPSRSNTPETGSTGSNATGSNATGADNFMMIANEAFAAYSANGVTMSVTERFTFVGDLLQNKFSWLAVDLPDGYKMILTNAVQYWVAATRFLVTQTREEMAGWLKQYYNTKFKQ